MENRQCSGCEINMQANLALICAFGLITLNDINVWFCKAKTLQQSDKCGEFMLPWYSLITVFYLVYKSPLH